MSAIRRHFIVAFNREFLPKQRKYRVWELRVWIFGNDRAFIYIHFISMAVIQTSVHIVDLQGGITAAVFEEVVSITRRLVEFPVESYRDLAMQQSGKQTIIFLCRCVDCFCSSRGYLFFVLTSLNAISTWIFHLSCLSAPSLYRLSMSLSH